MSPFGIMRADLLKKREPVKNSVREFKATTRMVIHSMESLAGNRVTGKECSQRTITTLNFRYYVNVVLNHYVE